MPRVEHDGLSVYYRVDGEGPWLTMVHGLSQSHMAWSGQLAFFAAGYRLVRVDLRGHGCSSAPLGVAYGQAEYLTDVLAVLDALGIACTHWWGTHTGAALGLLLAHQHPGRVAGLILDGAVIPGPPPPAVERATTRAREIARRDGAQAAIDDWFEQGAWFAGMRAAPERRRLLEHKDIVMAFSGAPWLSDTPPLPVPPVAEHLAAIDHPTLIINGSDDLPDFLDTAARLERELPHARRYLIPGAGAFPFWEEPGAVNGAVLRFLEEVD